MFEEFYHIKKGNFLGHELIGLKARFDGHEGMVRGESQKMLELKMGQKVKKVPKAGNEFEFELLDHSKVRVAGNHLLSRPEDRTKTWFKKYFKSKGDQ